MVLEDSVIVVIISHYLMPPHSLLLVDLVPFDLEVEAPIEFLNLKKVTRALTPSGH